MDRIDSQTATQLLEELVRVLQTHPPSISIEEKKAEIDLTYKENLERSESTRVNRLDSVPLLVSATTEGLEGSVPLLRICSVGCGNGAKDELFLREVLRAFPTTTVEYVGIDILEANCTDARLRISQISMERLKSCVLCRDFEADNMSDLQQFDIVNCCHMIYYASDLDCVTSKILSMVKKGGKATITATSNKGLSPMRKILWKYEGRHDFWTSNDVMKVLDMKDIKYIAREFFFLQDISKQVKDGFKSPVSKAVLDFTCQTQMKWHCKEVADLCIEYLTEVSKREDGSYIMNIPNNIVVIIL
jgi:2-polyprenyl-3-methyl-5-hydroxy-6-metoxy-1,4-benzoquinol methylase